MSKIKDFINENGMFIVSGLIFTAGLTVFEKACYRNVNRHYVSIPKSTSIGKVLGDLSNTNIEWFAGIHETGFEPKDLGELGTIIAEGSLNNDVLKDGITHFIAAKKC